MANQRNLWHEMTAPHDPDPDVARREYMTKVALIAMSAVSTSFALIGFLGWIAQAIPTDTFGILVMMSLFFSGGWWLANRGHWRVSGYIPPVFMFLAAAYGNYIGGVDAPAMLMYALTIILVAVLQGHRLQWGALALCLIAYLGIGVAHAQGYLTQLRSAETAFANRITIASAAMIAIAVLVWFLSTQYERALCQSHTLAEKAQTYAAALQEKTAELDRFFSSAIDLLCIADTNGYFRRLNREWENTLGYSLEELQGHRFLDFVHPDDVAETAKAASQLTSQKEILNFTNRYRCKDGSYRWIEWRSVPYGDRIYAAARDITERKRAEEALEKRIVALTRPLDDVSGIAFEDLFNVADIQRLQDEFADATGVASIITHPDGTPITKPSNFCRFCIGIVRKTDKGLVNCYRSDAALGRFSATGPTIQPCMSGGLWDAGAGISVGGRHIANWLIGQVRDETQTEEKIRAYAQEIGVDEETLVEAFREVPAMSHEQFQRVSQALFTLANQLSTSAYQNIQQARFITEHKQVEADRARFADRLSVAAKIATQVNTILDPDELLQTVILLIKEQFALYHVQVYTMDENEKALRLQAGYGEPGRIMVDRGHQIPLDAEKSLVARSARTKEAVLVDDVRAGPEFLPNPLLPDTRSEVAVPVIAGGKVLKVLDVQHNETAYFTNADLDVFRTLAGQIATALQNAQYFEQVGLSLAETEARLRVSQALAEAQTEEAVLDAMIQVAGFNPQAEVSIYTAVEGKEGKVTVRRAAAFDSGIETKMQVGSQFDLSYVPLFAHISPEKPFVSNNLAEDEAVDPASRAMAEQIGLASIGLLPLMVGRTWLGFISMNSKVQGAFDDRVLYLYQNLAEQGAAALQAARLRESLQITRTSVDQAQDAFFWFDDAGRITDVSEAASKMLGYTREEFLTMTASDLGRNFLPEAWEWLKAQVKQKGFMVVEREYSTREGKAVPVEATLSSLQIGAEAVHFFVVRDITERKEAELALRTSQERFQGLVENLSDWVWEVNVQGVYTYVSPKVKELLGYDPQELLGKTPFDLMPPEEVKRVVPALGQLMADRLPIRTLENTNIHKDGRLVIFETNGTPFFDEKGNFLGYRGADRDITERKRAEKQLQESEEKFRQIISRSLVGIFRTTPKGQVLEGNPVLLRITGYDSFETINRVGLSHLYADPQERTRLWELLQQGPVSGFETQYRRPDGTLVDVAISGKLMYDDNGELLYMEGTLEDITERKLIQEQLKESEKKFRQIIGRSLVGMYRSTPDGQLLECNPAMLRMMGFDSVEAVNAVGLSHCYADPQDRVRLWDLAQQGPVSGFETQYRRPDGTLVDVAISGSLIHDEKGQLLFLEGTFEDITARKQVEAGLQRERELFVGGPVAVFKWVNAEGWPVEYASPNLESFIGHPAEDLISGAVPYPMLIHPDDLTRVAKEVKTHTEEGKTSFEQEYRMVRADGEVIWVYDFTAIIRNERGEATHYDGYIINITDRKQIEETLKESEVRFRTLFETMTEGVALHELIYDEEGKAVDYRIFDANPAYTKHTGIPAEAILNKRSQEIYGTDTPPYFEIFSKVALTGEPLLLETYFPPLGKHFRISIISPKQGQFATVFEDITESKLRQQELEARNAEMERFTYTVSHDLRSPLITIKGFSGALEQDMATGREDRIKSDLQRIINAADKMDVLLSGLLELSRIGRVVNPPSTISMDALMREVLSLLAGPIAQRGVEVQVQPDLPTIYGDKQRMLEVMQNLIENAIKYMGEQPQPRIEIGVRDEDEAPVFFVRDNGIGIEPRYHQTIFGLFEKLDPKAEGTGIGLALVKRIIETHEGKIWVESEGKGQGSTFCFTLPPAQ